MNVDVAFGFLGAGKTTFISKVLQNWGTQEKIVVLVNEFGDIGIDGELLSSHGSNVVEMPSGCICCTLQSDFRTQILDIHQTFHPDRIIIEPSGVATISTIDWILKAQTLEPVIETISKILIVDATGFKSLYKANRRFIESQVEGAHLVLLNKCDRVDSHTAMLTQSAISSINPDVMVLQTEYGAVDWQEYQRSLFDTTPARPPMSVDPAMGEVSRRSDSKQHLEKGTRHHIPHFKETEDALGYESFGRIYENEVFKLGDLETFFQSLNSKESVYGEIVRAKGIFCVGENWVVMEQASGNISSQPIRPFQESKVTVIGKDLNRLAISEALGRCGKSLGNT